MIDDQELDILENMPSGIIAVDKQGRIDSFNSAAEKITSLSAGEMVGRYHDQVKELGRLSRLLKKTLTTGRTITRGQISLIKGRGRKVFLGVRTCLLRDRMKRVVGAMVVFRDITRLKQLEERLRQADRLAFIGEMTARVAHEVRNYLSSIRGYAQLMETRLDEDDSHKGYVRIIISEVGGLNKLVADLLAFAGQSKLHPEPHRLENILDDTIRMVSTSYPEKKVKIVRTPDNKLPEIWVDGEKIQRAFFNLICNGVEAIADEGEVKISTGVKGKKAEVEISDTGTGILPGIRGKIFNPFFTTRNKGTGLGLSISRRIVEDHRGTIEIDKLKRRGATFRVSLPIGRPREED